MKKESQKKETTKIEAYGIKGMNSKQWRRSFKSEADLENWVEKHNAEVQGVRDKVLT